MQTILDPCTDYPLSSFGQASATGLSRLTDGAAHLSAAPFIDSFADEATQLTGHVRLPNHNEQLTICCYCWPWHSDGQDTRLLPTTLTTINLNLLLREHGFEFYWEHQRWTDMIRFGKYEGTWTEKTNADVRKRVFPIPQTAIDGASNLPGYLTQNDGY